MGAHQVKNIARPIEVFALSAQAIDEMPRRQAPALKASRRRFGLLAGALSLCLVLTVGATYLAHRGAAIDLATQLDSILSDTQAKLNEKTRAKLVADYLAIGRHRAFAIAPKAQSHWWTGDWPTAEAAAEKALERCQLAFGEPCVLIATDEMMSSQIGQSERPARDMSRVSYSGDFDPAQIPGTRQLVSMRADVVGYLSAPGPKAAAIHPRGLLTIVTSAGSQRRAESQALKLCNDGEAYRDADGPCYLYALENRSCPASTADRRPITKP